ncbi:plexin-C1 [Xenopus laevis]|uniref:Plexin-C1 n=2 Tax=Xenopus laevis TaxID=8355 RepID=A0A1L8GYE3_XENLA|nr:plexin-C1 [Xenopus laevis]OCT88849.1 hypothetical protein XELAEV_18017479mg [Xenopus laevis]
MPPVFHVINLFSAMLSIVSVLSEDPGLLVNAVRNIAVVSDRVVVATDCTSCESCLYQFDHTLSQQLAATSVNGSRTECLGSAPRQTTTGQKPVYNMLLLVYNDTVLNCWVKDNCFCNERKLNHSENIISTTPNLLTNNTNLSAAGIVFTADLYTYLIIAAFTKNITDLHPISIKTRIDTGFITEDRGSYVQLATAAVLLFVDAFSWERIFFFPYFSPEEDKTKIISAMYRKGPKLQLLHLVHLFCDSDIQRGKILSSFNFTRSGGLFWAGIFSSQSQVMSPDKTALCIYNLTDMKQEKTNCIAEDFFDADNDCNPSAQKPHVISPINRGPTLTHGNLSAVFAVEVQNKMVFFLGTGDGQVLKVTLDSEWNANCPEILFQFDKDTAVFRTIKADPVNSAYIYVAAENKIKRIKVANCEVFNTYKECLSAKDPHCGWCHSQKRCTLNAECYPSDVPGNWNGISDDRGNYLDFNVVPIGDRQLRITAMSSTAKNTMWNCMVQNMGTNVTLCNVVAEKNSMKCSCQFSTNGLSDNDQLAIELTNGNGTVSDVLQLKKCRQLQNRCMECIQSGCLWCTTNAMCSSPLAPCKEYGEKANCTTLHLTTPAPPKPTANQANVTIKSISSDRIPYVGKNISITGENLRSLSRVVLFGTSSCPPQNIEISEIINDTHAVLSLPKGRKEVKSICFNSGENICSGRKTINYISLPSCSNISPNTAWQRGGRSITITGNNLDFVNSLTVSNTLHQWRPIPLRPGNISQCSFLAPPFAAPTQWLNISMKVEDTFISCGSLKYLENPSFTSFAVLNDVDTEIELRIKKTKDDLAIQRQEMQIQIYYLKMIYDCILDNITQNLEGSTVFCKAKKYSAVKIDVSKMKVNVTLGHFTTILETPGFSRMYILLLLLLIPILVVIIAACLVNKRKSKEMSNKLSEQLEQLECDVIEEIRNGFAELQMDKLDVTVESVGTIPFLDYKHFALRTLLPEMAESKNDFTEKLYETIPSPFRNRTVDENEHLLLLRKLFEKKRFLVHLIHTLEHQSNFSVKDRCLFASFLTISFQSNLLYLTELLEVLIKDLMDQSSNKHPKLMLRRTESVVEKLLTNWMSTCLYGYLREFSGEPLYLLVCMLNQRIHKGPIDAITCKALYTLNEDSLLWQMNAKFNSLDLNVYFPNDSEEKATESIKVTVLDCDTVGQAKEKIKQAFFHKKGYNWGSPLHDTCLVLHHGQLQKQLSDIDDTSVVLENGIIKLNTLKHYKIEDGVTIKVTVQKNCDVQDLENSSKYCHLVLPSSQGMEEVEGEESKGKHKFKVKELYLTKLLSTKVAIHSTVEKLFRSIWTIPANKPPIAVKYFFDFLDSQAENKKIADPDVLHIWKTNSLPLRFWVNILKNPQFVFDLKKTNLLESCLSVIAQAFMDSFSISEQQLGKSSPTNKLLYAKDIAMFKEEVKNYYKGIRDAPPVSSSELNEFLTTESKKHKNEFKEDVALLELYKYIERYHQAVLGMLEKEAGFEDEQKQLLHIKALMEDKKKCMWN